VVSWAGNAIEKQLKRKPGYRIVVRMQDKTHSGRLSRRCPCPVAVTGRVQGRTLALMERDIAVRVST